MIYSYEHKIRPLCVGSCKGLLFLSTMDDEKWMRFALDEAKEAFRKDEIPIGAVIIRDGRLISRGYNMTETLQDATAHAEMIAITAAEQKVGKYLQDCTLYVTVEPCLMCAGAIGWSQIKRVVYGTDDVKKGFSTYLKPGVSPFHPKAPIVSGILEKECRELLIEFFRKKRGIL